MHATPAATTTNKLKTASATATKTSTKASNSSGSSTAATIKQKPFANDSTDEIEEISKKISEHADAIYRTWKSRGLAPEKLLDFYANAAAESGGATAADFFAPSPSGAGATAAAAAESVPTEATVQSTEGLQKLVSTFVLKDKEQRGVKMVKGIKQDLKTMTKTPIQTQTMPRAGTTSAEKIAQKKAMSKIATATTTTTTTNSITSKTPRASAVLLKAADLDDFVEASATVIKTTAAANKISKPLATTTQSTITSANKKKLIIGNADNELNNNNNYKTLHNSASNVEQRNNKISNSNTTKTTNTKPNINVDINLNLDLNLDVNNLTQLQATNLLKIKELLQQEEKEIAKKAQKKQVAHVKQQQQQQQQQEPQQKENAIAIKTSIKTPTITTTVTKTNASAKGGAAASTCAQSGALMKTAATATTATTATTTATNSKENDKDNKNEISAKALATNDNQNHGKKVAKNLNKITTTIANDHDVVDIAKAHKVIDVKPITTTTPTTTPTPMTMTTATATTTQTAAKTKTSTTTTTTAPATTLTLSSISATLSTLTPTIATNDLALATLNPNAQSTRSNTTKPTTILANNSAKAIQQLQQQNHHIDNKIPKDNIATIDSTAAITANSNSNSNNNKRAVAANNTTATISADSGMEIARSTMPTPTKVKAGRAALTNGQDKNIGRPILTRGSVAERVLMFEKCPDVRNSFLNIKRPQQIDEPPKSLLKIKLHATPPPPPEQNSLQKEIRSSKSVYIPRFYFPHGKPQPQIALERTLRGILSAFDSFPNNQVTKDELPRILKLCGIPFYWRMPVMVFCQQGNSGLVERQRFVEFWKQMNVYCHDACSRFIYILSRGQRFRQYILPEDFVPLVQDVVDTHPGLAFLKEAIEFHSRYVHTVIARIFYSVNRSWSGKMSMSELKKSDLLEILQLLEEEDDINQIMAFFSYEHFYVIYCKFWELDKDHDLLINQDDLARHSDHALSQRIVERIFSGCVTRNDNKKETDDEPKMTYTEFVWFLLSEEDKRTPTAIEYWFRCMDIDGDGVLSMYELEYFYEEQQQRMESIGIETLPFEDCLCQMLDMIKPARRDCISLGDLKRCKMTHVFFDTFFNLEKYLDHEQRDPFATQRDEYSSDWDRFAAQEYELLITEEND